MARTGLQRGLAVIVACLAVVLVAGPAIAVTRDGTSKGKAIIVTLSDGPGFGDETLSRRTLSPSGCSNTLYDVLYFKWTSEYTGTVEADTNGSAQGTFGQPDTVLAVYDKGTFLDCNDDHLGVHDSLVQFAAVAGHTYYFAVGEFDGTDLGTVYLKVDPV
jgi:hypothetical protein